MENLNEQLLLGESFAYWVRTLIISLGAVVAVLTLRKNEIRAKKRATFDVVLAENLNDKLIEAKNDFTKLRIEKVDFELLAEKAGKKTNILGIDDETETSEQYKEDTKVVLRILRQYEFISTAIHENTLDEKMYFRMKRSIFLKDWETLKPFIIKRQKILNNRKIFCEFLKLGNKWKNKSQRMKF